jgi:hypothetical protein
MLRENLAGVILGREEVLGAHNVVQRTYILKIQHGFLKGDERSMRAILKGWMKD